MTTSNSIRVKPRAAVLPFDGRKTFSPGPFCPNITFFITALLLNASDSSTPGASDLLQKFMDKKNTLLVVVLLALVSVYIVFFTGLFKPHVIKVGFTTRPMSDIRRRGDLPYVCFMMGGKTRLTEVKVVSAADFKKNPNTPALWHLVSDSNSVPVAIFVYGQHIHGMRAKYKGEQPQDLETNQLYTLFVSSGWAHGQLDFRLK